MYFALKNALSTYRRMIRPIRKSHTPNFAYCTWGRSHSLSAVVRILRHSVSPFLYLRENVGAILVTKSFPTTGCEHLRPPFPPSRSPRRHRLCMLLSLSRRRFGVWILVDLSCSCGTVVLCYKAGETSFVWVLQIMVPGPPHYAFVCYFTPGVDK